MPKKEKDLHEIAARALCRKAGLPENTMNQGRPMWMSFLGEVDAVFKAIKLDELIGGNRLSSEAGDARMTNRGRQQLP